MRLRKDEQLAHQGSPASKWLSWDEAPQQRLPGFPPRTELRNRSDPMKRVLEGCWEEAGPRLQALGGCVYCLCPMDA